MFTFKNGQVTDENIVKVDNLTKQQIFFKD